MDKNIKELSKKIKNEIDKNGWSITAHTWILALLSQIREAKTPGS